MSSAMKNGILGATMGFVMSFLITRYFIPMPSTVVQNALCNGVSGILSGFMGGFMGGFIGLLADLVQRDNWKNLG